jgi:hypothetical protein
VANLDILLDIAALVCHVTHQLKNTALEASFEVLMKYIMGAGVGFINKQLFVQSL